MSYTSHINRSPRCGKFLRAVYFSLSMCAFAIDRPVRLRPNRISEITVLCTDSFVPDDASKIPLKQRILLCVPSVNRARACWVPFYELPLVFPVLLMCSNA